MKTKKDIYENIVKSFKQRRNATIQQGTVFDLLTLGCSSEIEEAYKEIEKNKKPYIFTSQKGKDLDSTGYFLNLPRETDESDENYLYRLMNWTLINESCNATAIQSRIINLKYSSNANYMPLIHGACTGAIYIIPLDYSEDGILKAISEVKSKVENVKNPSSIIDYIVPEKAAVKLSLYCSFHSGDESSMRQLIEQNIKEYINNLAPGEYLEVGKINKIGTSIDNVNYFNVLELFINNEIIAETELLQKIDSKFLLDSINWLKVSE